MFVAGCQVTQNICAKFRGVSSEYMWGNNPPGIHPLDHCRALTFPASAELLTEIGEDTKYSHSSVALLNKASEGSISNLKHNLRF